MAGKIPATMGIYTTQPLGLDTRNFESSNITLIKVITHLNHTLTYQLILLGC